MVIKNKNKMNLKKLIRIILEEKRKILNEQFYENDSTNAAEAISDAREQLHYLKDDLSDMQIKKIHNLAIKILMKHRTELDFNKAKKIILAHSEGEI